MKRNNIIIIMLLLLSLIILSSCSDVKRLKFKEIPDSIVVIRDFNEFKDGKISEYDGPKKVTITDKEKIKEIIDTFNKTKYLDSNRSHMVIEYKFIIMFGDEYIIVYNKDEFRYGSGFVKDIVEGDFEFLYNYYN